MDADELCRIEPLFQSRDRLEQQIRPVTQMQPNVVALGIDPAETDGNPAVVAQVTGGGWAGRLAT